MSPIDVPFLCGKLSLAILGPVLFVLVALFLVLTYFVAIILTILYVPRAVLIRNLHW